MFWATVNLTQDSRCCRSVTNSCPTNMNCSPPGSSVLHCLPEVARNSCLLSWWCYVTNSSLVSPSLGVSSNESALCIRWPKYYSLGRLTDWTNKVIHFKTRSLSLRKWCWATVNLTQDMNNTQQWSTNVFWTSQSASKEQ